MNRNVRITPLSLDAPGTVFLAPAFFTFCGGIFMSVSIWFLGWVGARPELCESELDGSLAAVLVRAD